MFAKTCLALYGFLTHDEKNLFEKLIGVSNIGPGLAIKVLSGMAAGDLLTASAAARSRSLVRIPGVGKKTAERMVLELRDKLPAPAGEEPAPRCAVAFADRRRCVVGAAESGLRAARRPKRRCEKRAPRALRTSLSRCSGKLWSWCADGRNPTAAGFGVVGSEDEQQFEAGLRPRRLADFTGQARLKENLQIAIEAARKRGEAMDHVLLYGPPGLGKTTLGVHHRAGTGSPVSRRPPARCCRRSWIFPAS